MQHVSFPASRKWSRQRDLLKGDTSSPHTTSADTSHSALTHLGEQGACLLMLMAKSRHKKPENVRRYFKPSPEAISELTSLLAPGNARR